MEPRITRDTAGFTLIELMMVVTILSLLTLSVGLGLNRPRGDRAQDWARFAVIYDQIRAQAILSGEYLGLAVDTGGHQRMRREAGTWVPEGTRSAWRGGVALIAPRDSWSPLIFAPGGQATAVMLRFDGDGGTRLCRTDGWNAVTCAGS